jgi:GalNAc-alpha-(1->4)-GalNAc-alpha-(1->3)-diNAcBac-PP-undecaprenol alpha-1,4-N-acetyl-D-galactosaminyltransferase
MALIPNGTDLRHLYELTNGVKDFNEKENIVLSVGRIGNPQKNNEMLLEAIPKLHSSNWKFYFAGPIEPRFEQYIECYFETYPHLREQVIFTGNISEPSALYEIYNRAKLFCLSSLWEGFPLSAVEAATFGNVLLLNESIYAFNTLTDHGKNGLSFNEDNIVEVLLTALNDDTLLLKMYQNTLIYAEKQFSWANSVKKIESIMNQ